jgi:cyclopropane-fatty-acyl-phospholipid synthase
MNQSTKLAIEPQGDILLLTRDTPKGQLSGLPRMVRSALRFLTALQFGALTITFPDGQRVRIEGQETGPDGAVTIKDYKAVTAMLRRGDIGFAEAYMDGHWDSPDIVEFLQVFYINKDMLLDIVRSMPLFNIMSNLRHWLRGNTKRQAKKNIHAHYDLGNDFYSLWLDPSMTYSSAIFRDGINGLEAAQREKYASLARKIDLKPEHHVLEIGCGWGGFAEYAASEIGCRVTGLTISEAQRHYAIARMEKAGLSDKVEIVHRDYRDETGQYDRIASIEMIEAVGESYWPTYFAQLHDRLKPGGRAGVQAITIRDGDFDTYRMRPDFVQTYIFPGGMLPSSAIMEEMGRKNGLAVTENEDFGHSYARTLNEWCVRFEEVWPQITTQGFDERFRKLWRYYLKYCEAGFLAGNVNVRQVAFQRPL